MWLIWDSGVIFMLFKALRIDWFGIEGHTLDMIIFFAGNESAYLYDVFVYCDCISFF